MSCIFRTARVMLRVTCTKCLQEQFANNCVISQTDTENFYRISADYELQNT